MNSTLERLPARGHAAAITESPKPPADESAMFYLTDAPALSRADAIELYGRAVADPSSVSREQMSDVLQILGVTRQQFSADVKDTASLPAIENQIETLGEELSRRNKAVLNAMSAKADVDRKAGEMMAEAAGVVRLAEHAMSGTERQSGKLMELKAEILFRTSRFRRDAQTGQPMSPISPMNVSNYGQHFEPARR